MNGWLVYCQFTETRTLQTEVWGRGREDWWSLKRMLVDSKERAGWKQRSWYYLVYKY